MRSATILAVAVVIANVSAFSFGEMSTSAIEALKKARDAIPTLSERSGGSGSSGSGSGGSCPAIWTTIVSDLTTMFLNKTSAQCTDDARAAIRAAFHDCGTWDQSQGLTGGCDGSLVLAHEAENRGENGGLQDIAAKYRQLSIKYPTVSMADLIQVASSVAIVTCPGGPRVTTYVGRVDNSSVVGNPPNGLPDVHAPAASLYDLFTKKGFSAVDLAALLGAHTTSKALAQPDIPVGTPQDATPGLWDIRYYQDTLTPPTGCVPFASDVSLAAHPTVGKEFNGFVGNQGKWVGKFADAMLKMSLLGVPGGTNPSKLMIDCTSVIPKGTSNKRELKGMPVFSFRN